MKKLNKLLTRHAFREGVFSRDKNRCVICGKEGVLDAHHIIDRKVWADGGYYLDNGASLCPEDHIKAELCLLDCDTIRNAAKIKDVILPEQLDPELKYNKWGNLI